MNTTLLLTATALLALANVARAQGTAFTYQGRLDSSGTPSTGGYDLRVAVFDAAAGGNLRGLITNSAVAVSNGLFTTTLDFGFGVFNGGPRWLEIAVRSNGTASAFAPLAPRQAVLPAPYAFWSANASQAVTVTGTVPSSGLNGVYSNPVSFGNPANGFAGDGGGLNNVNAAQLSGRSAAQFWQTGGNAGTSPATDFLGTADKQPLELRVNGQRAFRLEPNTNGAPNVIGGSPRNFVTNGVVGATVGGGGATNYSGFAVTNRVAGNFGTVSGGGGNQAQGTGSTVAGGWFNLASGFISAVGGGQLNTASGDNSVVVGGVRNTASGEHATVMGFFNTASGFAATAVGSETMATNNDSTAMGRLTLAGGSASTAMGYRARALHNGSFVWADQQDVGFDSTSTNQFSLRASGGVRLANDTSLSFGNQHRQMINLYNTDYGIGAQSETTYFRTGAEFRWYRGGTHSDAFGDPGTGGRSLMRLGSSGDLLLQGKLGIGTTTAGAQLEVVAAQGIGRFTSTNTGNGSVLIFNNQSALPDYLGAINFETNGMTVGQIGYLANDRLVFRTGGVDRMSLDAGGLTVNGAFVSSSDRNIKQDFAAVNPQEVLEKVAGLPIQSWAYTNAPGAKHYGPMAQDFHAAFGLNGADDTHIATVDADGVALAAIQGLNEKVEGRMKNEEALRRGLEARLQQKETEIEELKRTVNALKEALVTLNDRFNRGTP